MNSRMAEASALAPLRALIVEDSEDDALQAVRQLRRGGYDVAFKRVDTAAGMKQALDGQVWDIVISDYAIPGFGGVEALRLLRGRDPDLPFVIVSGTIGEETAVAAMKAGAADYVIKGNLARLAPAVRRELADATMRGERRMEKEALRTSEESSLAASERLRLVIESAPLAIHTRDRKGLITSWNPAAERMYGWTAAEVLGKPLPGVPDDAREESDRVRMRVLAGESMRQEARRRRRDGTSIDIDAFSATLRGRCGEIEGLITIAADITERRHAECALLESEARLRQVNAQLERRVVERTAELQAANSELEAFGYSISHDLRAPLGRIQGFAAALLQDQATALDDQGKDRLQRIVKASEDMDQLVDDLFSLSTVAKGDIQRTDVDLGRLAQEIVAVFRRTHPEREVEVVAPPGTMAHADRGLARVVLENLLGNAWKFTARSERARIEVGRASQGGHAIFFVRDNGAGFDMAHAERLFMPFQRLHSRGEFGGTGIGLATVQRIVRRHGGRIWAEAEVGRGATFFFTLSPKVHSS